MHHTVVIDRLSITGGLKHGLSRMKGNFHVRFLGEGEAVTLCPYPTVNVHRLWTSASDEELAALSVAFPEFMRYARLMEDMSEALRTGVGVLQGVTDLTRVEEPSNEFCRRYYPLAQLWSSRSSTGEVNSCRTRMSGGKLSIVGGDRLSHL
jgi:hypothetical protein